MKFHKDGTLPTNGEIFVFGSNLAGVHGAGAAKVAAEKFGARSGIHTGTCGRSYAIPTKDYKLNTRSLTMINVSIALFKGVAKKRSNEQFFVTRIGCGLAGYHDSQIAPMFKGAPDNCSFAEEWREYL
jgi:hypothetical protein